MTDHPIYGNGRKIFFFPKGQKIFGCIMQTCGFHIQHCLRGTAWDKEG